MRRVFGATEVGVAVVPLCPCREEELFANVFVGREGSGNSAIFLLVAVQCLVAFDELRKIARVVARMQFTSHIASAGPSGRASTLRPRQVAG